MSAPLLGQLLALLAASGFALSVVFLAKSKRGRGDGGVFFSVIVTFAFAALLWLFTEARHFSLHLDRGFWIGCFWFGIAGVFAMILGRNLVFNSIRSLGPTRASATKRLNPFFSVAFAAGLLNEPISTHAAYGLMVIALGVALMIYQSLNHAAARGVEAVPLSGYLWGIGAALAYAAAYTARKLGLEALPAPAFGTLISAAVAIGLALISALLAPAKVNLAATFRDLDRWIVLGSVAMSLAQIMLFMALLYEKISVVVMIASLEVFIASFFSVVVFKSEKRPPLLIFVAGIVSTFGVLLVTFE